MSEIELSEKSPKRDLEKSYEAVEMLNAKHDVAGYEKEKGSTKDSGEEITLRRVFFWKTKQKNQDLTMTVPDSDRRPYI